MHSTKFSRVMDDLREVALEVWEGGTREEPEVADLLGLGGKREVLRVLLS